MPAFLQAVDIGKALSDWPQPDGWTGIGFVATVLGFVAGMGSLILTILIFRWTNASDAERHAELTDGLHQLGETLKEQFYVSPAPEEADLTGLLEEEKSKLRALLHSDERIVSVARSGSGKGNHPWQAVTTEGRVLQVYRGGRGGGVHARPLG